MNIEEVEEPETTKIHIQNPSTPAAPSPKVRKFTDKTNMQARNHENSDGFRPPPRSGHPAFSPTVRTPSVKHTVWGKKHLHPWRLTWIPKMKVWKMIFLFKQLIFRFQPLIFQSVASIKQIFSQIDWGRIPENLLHGLYYGLSQASRRS